MRRCGAKVNAGLMPLEIVLEQEGKGVLVTASGEVTPQEILSAKEKIYFGGGATGLEYQIWHFPEGPKGERSHEELRSMAMLDAEALKKHPGMKVAIVLGGGPVREETRMYLLYSSVWAKQMQTQVFNEMKSARDWIEGTAESAEKA